MPERDRALPVSKFVSPSAELPRPARQPVPANQDDTILAGQGFGPLCEAIRTIRNRAWQTLQTSLHRPASVGPVAAEADGQ